MVGHSVNFIIIVNMSVRTDGKLDNLNFTQIFPNIMLLVLFSESTQSILLSNFYITGVNII